MNYKISSNLERKMQELYRLAENLKRLRLQYGYSQSHVADVLGIRPPSYHAYEAGIAIPTLKNFIKLAKLYDVSLDDLIE